ncbi:MAG: hypothetical protein HYU04_02850 [Candidatus Wildermuthbacteria bacterium]|nr:hypothetical protein [Candidatus Wildermuthbacteria bacterium]
MATNIQEGDQYVHPPTGRMVVVEKIEEKDGTTQLFIKSAGSQDNRGEWWEKNQFLKIFAEAPLVYGTRD